MKNILLTLSAVVMLFSLAGCAATLPAQLPAGFQVKPAGRSDVGAPFQAGTKGAVAAVAQGAVELTDKQGRKVRLADRPATAISFSPGGEKVALVLPVQNATLLRIVDLEGKTLGETRVTGKVTSVAWRSENELLAGVLKITKFSFGSQMATHLLQWDGKSTPVDSTIIDITLRPQVASLPEDVLYDQLHIAVSPYRDEIAFTSLKDPPLFAPYLKVLVRNLDTGGGYEVGQVPLGAGKVFYTPDGESLVFAQGVEATRRVSLPEGKELETWGSPAINPAASPSGTYLLLDGHLYRKGKEIASVPPDARGSFLPDGSGLVLSYRGNLFHVSGLDDGAPAALRPDLERVLKLRRLRSQGLITEQEYRKELEPKEPAR
ncbi:hypothetical protein [Geomonas azotofigens]|uniref:hypothetical protein n=1 Tax=Geomonas azotofigens TaxID=2843196 RepID=UPI001C127BEA|nr:hypothetical protein [Geomonas azotofigens]MBU5615024.1 hypothetical protein [Geomonas azotofigens]